MKPLFRWPGGKRWLVPIVREIAARADYQTYHEPFAGAAAVFFDLAPRSAWLSDVNLELMSAYRIIRDRPKALFRALSALPHGEDDYYAIREWSPPSGVDAAARFLYLRQTAFGGIYRTNRAGQFNVPYGGLRRKEMLSLDDIRSAAAALATAELECDSFEASLRIAQGGAFVYADPPYAASETEGEQFSRYTDRYFAWSDQEALAKLLGDLARQGAYIVASNADLPGVRDLYPAELFHRVRIDRSSCVARDATHRGSITEALFVSKTIYRSRAAVQRIISLCRT